MAHNARYARLAIEYTKLMNLAARSSFINVKPVEVQRGWPPEKYIVTYTCRGIASIDANEAPVISNFHQVSMYMGSDYPLKEPYLKWLTPIWHPNIDHLEPHHVCTNNVQNWYAAKPLAELVLAMGEMVQYKHYHAKWISPFPLDRAAADWVLEVAEPGGIVGPNKPFDDRPLLKAQRMRNQGQDPRVNLEESMGKIRLGRVQAAAATSAPTVLLNDNGGQIDPAPLQPVAKAIRFGARARGSGEIRRLDTPLEERVEGSTAATYSIEVNKDGQLQRVEHTSKTLLTVGRGAINNPVDLTLQGDLTLSRLHLILERDESGAFWMTAKGQNPVLVNGRVIPKDRSIAIDVGQTIDICSYSIVIR
jgi:ubiquitin-protein ligase